MLFSDHFPVQTWGEKKAGALFIYDAKPRFVTAAPLVMVCMAVKMCVCVSVASSCSLSQFAWDTLGSVALPH